ncbi:MAG: zinc ribbon domain-containing protein [Treponema sp.]|jgi:putative FmdB family regulatory protein|nr:zinc ribbon domain-containing protein [Treponema sp.]
MPTYEYECKSCGHVFEVFQNMSDDPLKNCPQCGKDIRRLIHGGTGIIFKGSGFYVTDKKGGTSSGSTSGGTKAGTVSSAETAKPETAKPDSPADSSKPAPAPAAEKKAAG